MSMNVCAATAIVAALVFAACGGASDDAVPTGPAPPTTPTGSLESSVVETDAPVAEPSSTNSSTATTSPAEPTPTTTAPSVESQVRAASTAAYDSYWECLRAPDQCDVGSWNLPGSDAFNFQAESIADLISGGLYVGAEDVGYMVIESINVQEDHTAVTSCWWATAVLYFRPPIAGAEPTIQNNRTESGRQVDEFVQDPEDGVWKIRRSDILTTTEGKNECPAEQ